MKKTIIKIGVVLAACAGSVLTSCVETDSPYVEYADDNPLNSLNDTLFSVMGIVNKMQAIADRTILLGELRGDLCTLNGNASTDLQGIANFTAKPGNVYADPRDYYAVIQNCNYYITHADSTLKQQGEPVMVNELTAVRAFRAWTYMQLALNYGRVPFVTQPILAEKDADISAYPMVDIDFLTQYFIDELKPYVGVGLPTYASNELAINDYKLRLFFIPVRVLLGEMCLWSGRYEEACKYYYEYLTSPGARRPVQNIAVRWSGDTFSTTEGSSLYLDQYSEGGSATVTAIPMALTPYDGIVSRLTDVFASTDNNNYYPQATSSQSYKDLSMAQKYTLIKLKADGTNDTITPAASQYYSSESLRGDLRYSAVIDISPREQMSDYESPTRQTVKKYSSQPRYVPIYRLPGVYLHFAEALNRAGMPDAAFAVLKYGLSPETINRTGPAGVYSAIGAASQLKAAEMAPRLGRVNVLNFPQTAFTRDNTAGIHARGCGNVEADKDFDIPSLPALQDSILYVEDKLCDEMALELSFEGTRFYDLMRLAKHRGTPAYLADKVARRNGTRNEALFSHLSDTRNWYLPLQ